MSLSGWWYYRVVSYDLEYVHKTRTPRRPPTSQPQCCIRATISSRSTCRLVTFTISKNCMFSILSAISGSDSFHLTGSKFSTNDDNFPEDLYRDLEDQRESPLIDINQSIKNIFISGQTVTSQRCPAIFLWIYPKEKILDLMTLKKRSYMDCLGFARGWRLVLWLGRLSFEFHCRFFVYVKQSKKLLHRQTSRRDILIFVVTDDRFR